MPAKPTSPTSTSSSVSTSTPTSSVTETVRFLCVGLAGFIIDISIVWSLINFYAMGEELACIIGFAIATGACFFAHRNWTFPNAPRATLWRFLGYWSVTLFTLAVRLVLFTQLGEVFSREELPIPVRLALAGGVAFVLAYLLSNKLVFNPSTQIQKQ